MVKRRKVFKCQMDQGVVKINFLIVNYAFKIDYTQQDLGVPIDF